MGRAFFRSREEEMGKRCAKPVCDCGWLCSGQTVTVLRLPSDAPPYIEGRGTLGKHDGGYRHWVRFGGEPIWRLRTVHPQLQNNPEALLAALSDLWRAERALSASIFDFFPTEQP